MNNKTEVLNCVCHSDEHVLLLNGDDWEDENLLKFISKLNLTAKKNNPTFYYSSTNLGKQDVINDSEIDPSNYNAFYSIEVK